MPVWLVTGGSGFLGRHLLAALSAGAPTRTLVYALGRTCPAGWPPGRFLRADLTDRDALMRAVRIVAPDLVLHAAGRTPPADPEPLYRANNLATTHLLEALKLTRRPTRVVVAGSAAELGPVPVEDLPVAEDYPCQPVNAYGASKWLATEAALSARTPVEAIVARVFNPIGPGMPPSHAFGRFAAILSGPGPDPVRLPVGDLDARRDFVDIRDVASAMIALAHRGRGGEVYHVGTGGSRRVGEGLDHLIRLSGRTVEVVPSAQAAPPPGPADSRADIRKITSETGWAPLVPWERSLADIWADARDRAAGPASRHVA